MSWGLPVNVNASLPNGTDYGTAPGPTEYVPPTPTAFGDFSKMAAQGTAKAQEQMTVNDYMKQFEEEANRQDQIRAAGIDPRGYSSRALKALKNIIAPSNYYGESNEQKSNEAENFATDLLTLLDPTAWVANTEGVSDPGQPGGELSYQKYPNLKLGQTLTTSDGKIWKFKGKIQEESKGGFKSNQYINLFDFVTDPKKLSASDATKAYTTNNSAASAYAKQNTGFAF
jgi:hypothetical protein